MQSILPSRLLRLALVVDAAATGALAVLQLALPDALSRLLMLPRGLLLETGAFLVGYVILLVVMARSQRLWSWLVRTVVVGNVLWAVGCAALLAGPAQVAQLLTLEHQQFVAELRGDLLLRNHLWVPFGVLGAQGLHLTVGSLQLGP